MMRMRAFTDSALAISTICRWPIDSCSTGVRGEMSSPKETNSCSRIGFDAPSVDKTPAMRLPAQEDIGADAEILRQVQFLVDQDNAESESVMHGRDLDSIAIQMDRSRVGPVHACEDLHQRAFAGAVFADDGKDFPAAQLSCPTRSSAFTPGKRLVRYSTWSAGGFMPRKPKSFSRDAKRSALRCASRLNGDLTLPRLFLKRLPKIIDVVFGDRPLGHGQKTVLGQHRLIAPR